MSAAGLSVTTHLKYIKFKGGQGVDSVYPQLRTAGGIGWFIKYSEFEFLGIYTATDRRSKILGRQ
jgi:hypothetical protein